MTPTECEADRVVQRGGSHVEGARVWGPPITRDGLVGRRNGLTVGSRGERVLFVSGTGGGSARYRCEFKAEQVRLAGGRADALFAAEVDMQAVVDAYDCFILHRVPWKRPVGRFLERARLGGKSVVADADDLVFDPDAAALAPTNRPVEKWRRLFERQRQTLEACGAALVSTAPLAECASRHVRTVAVAPNVVGEVLVERAEEALATNVQTAGVTIGYFSGTPTHDRDFAEAVDPLIAVMERFSDARLLVVGPLELDPRFARFGGRVTRLPRQPMERLPELVALADLNLAPLEHDNPFTEAKSCVKYLEAGLVAVPTIATRYPDFERVIRHGENGLLASSYEEWAAALELLVSDPELRRRMGARAREDVLAHHTTRARADEYARTLAAVSRAGRIPPLRRRLIQAHRFETRARASLRRRARGFVKKP